MGGAIAKTDIASIDEDTDPQCNYCHAATSTVDHIKWECPFFKQIRIDTDPELADVPLKYLLPCIKCGIAPVMKPKGETTY